MTADQEILIIGNGSSVLDFKYGEIIDRFQNVARINNYEVDAFKEHVGQKTDIWFHGNNKKVRPRKQVPGKVVVFIPSPVYEKFYERVEDRIKERQNLDKNQYELVPIAKIREFEKSIQSDRVTTGTSSILWALENYKRVVIHGFDFFINSKEHYFDSKVKKWISNNLYTPAKKHNTQNEMNYIQSQIKMGNIEVLEKYKAS